LTRKVKESQVRAASCLVCGAAPWAKGPSGEGAEVIKKLCAIGAVTAATAGVTLLAVPAHADSWTDYWSDGWYAFQSGNSLDDIAAVNEGGDGATNVNNLNGIATTAANGSTSVTYVFY
jgi:hypothetical protein